jgi:hypothetical protein
MSELPEALGPENVEDLHDPDFLAYLKKRAGFPIKPDAQDVDWLISAETEAEQAHQYRLAQARKMLRVYGEWKAGLN